MSRQRVVAKLQEAGYNHDKIIIEKKEAIENLGKKLIKIKEDMQRQSENLLDCVGESPSRETGITFVDESQIALIQTVSTQGTRCDKERLVFVNSSDPTSASSITNDKALLSLITKEFELMAQESSDEETKKFENMIYEKREIEKSMAESLYQIIGDNLDFYIKVKHMTSENQNK